MKSRRLEALAIAAIAALAVGSVHANANAGGAKAAYYTAAQAQSGAKLYAAECSRCHGTNLEGVNGPALKGPAMAGSQSVSDIYGFVTQQMPAGAPGSLPQKTYTMIMAYLLKENGHPAGAKPLTPAVAKAIKAKI